MKLKISENLSRFFQGSAVVLALSFLAMGLPINATPEKHNINDEGWTTDHPHTQSRSGCLVKSTNNVGGGAGGGAGGFTIGISAGKSWTKTGCWAAPQEGDEYMHFHDIPKNKKNEVEQGHASCEVGESFRVDIEVTDTRQEVQKEIWDMGIIGGHWGPGTRRIVTVVEGELTISYLGGKCLTRAEIEE